MKLFKLFGYVFVYAVTISTMLCYYPLKDIYGYMTAGAFAAGAAILLLLSLNRAVYWIELDNPYIVGGWISLSLFLFLLLYSADTGQELYTFFILAAAALVGLLNLDKPRYILLQHEPKTSVSFARGMIWGMIVFVVANFAMLVCLGFEAVASPAVLREMLVGPITSQLEQWFGIGAEFLAMLFIVAVPEELMGRVFYMKMGSAVTDPFTAGLITLVSGYAMHAVSRYDIEYGTLVLFVLTIVWLILTIVYVRHGLLGSIAAHATYNTLITAAIYGFTYLIVTTLIMIIIAFGVLYIKKQLIVF